MRILLLGDYSGLHVNLSQGLRILGQDVTLASGGDLWKDFERDIDLKQPEKHKRSRFLWKLAKAYPRLRGYDVVQLIHPNPLATNPHFNSLFLELIKKSNDHLFLGANGMDYYYCNYALQGNLKYSVFQVPQISHDPHIETLKRDTYNATIIKQNKSIAEYADGITSCAVGYYQAYKEFFPDKTTHIPLPLNTDKYPYISNIQRDTKKIRFFLGKMKGREVRKGADIIENVLQRLHSQYPNEVSLNIVSSVPFKEYTKLLNSSHILCDQMYAYGIGMNGLIAQSKGLIAAGGADEEVYKLNHETENKPIIDLNVTEQEMFHTFESLIANKHLLKEQAIHSRDYVVKHHNYIKVAQEYLDFWNSKI